MKNLRIFFLTIISMFGLTFTSTRPNFIRDRKIKKAAKALKDMARNYNQFTDTDQVMHHIIKIKHKFFLTKAEWYKALHLKFFYGMNSLNAMEIIDEKIWLLHCDWCTTESVLPCSSTFCTICRDIKMRFNFIIRDYERQIIIDNYSTSH